MVVGATKAVKLGETVPWNKGLLYKQQWRAWESGYIVDYFRCRLYQMFSGQATSPACSCDVHARV